MHKNLQIILRFSPFFSIFLRISLILSDFLRFSLIFSDFSPNFPEFLRFSLIFLRISLIFSEFPVFSSYLCTRKSASRKEGGGVIIFMKVLKNDEALPSEIDSRAFLRVLTKKAVAHHKQPPLSYVNSCIPCPHCLVVSLLHILPTIPNSLEPANNDIGKARL